ncbi:hypothetical protein HY439_02715 [Candidatus Microgenomates bacterium]|nr:hypothetical protein [Candidatus Microgenomates bacterium]
MNVVNKPGVKNIPMENAVLKTLAYADVFDYPLTEKELFRWLIKDPDETRIINPNKSEWKDKFGSIRSKSSDKFGFKDGFYFLKKREKIVRIRQEREKWSRVKLIKARRITHFLKLIPTIKMIALTGTLAVRNSEQDDDIDILIVSKTGTLWLTRFWTTILLEILGQRRRPREKETKDKICLNMFLDEEHLQISPEDQDLYTAHEVAQLISLWDRDYAHEKFLKANLWVKKYLPKGIKTKNRGLRKHNSGPPVLTIYAFALFEKFFKNLQLWYMRRHRTTEIISDGAIRFHPQDARKWILASYYARIRNLPLDK